jgi:hypothetical protein
VRHFSKEVKKVEGAYNNGTNVVIGFEGVSKWLQHDTTNPFSSSEAISTLIECERFSFV